MIADTPFSVRFLFPRFSLPVQLLLYSNFNIRISWICTNLHSKKSPYHISTLKQLLYQLRISLLLS
nr:MAG TPA_asm: hypothetical protein [Caudoviricetes sp.]